MDYTYTEDASQNDVTITVLPASLSLVHIPRDRLTRFSHPIIDLLLRPNPTFLNVSCNDTEVSIIASESDLAPFVRIAQRDGRKANAAAGDAESSKTARVPAPVEVSSSWTALQIDSHGDQLGDASARIREISALLSGISILYQSSYTTDFIFVQSKLLPEVLSILTAHNFLSLASLPSDLVSSCSSFPSTRSNTPPLADSEDPSEAFNNLGLEIRSRRGTTSSHASLHSLLLAKSASVDPPRPLHKTLQPPRLDTATPVPAPLLRKSLSPCTPSVTILPSDLVVVGLSEQPGHTEAWTMKLIKLLLFRHTIYTDEHSSSYGSRRSASESSGTEDLDREGPVLGVCLEGDDFSDSSSSSSGSFHSSKSSIPSFPPSPSAPALPFFSLSRTLDGTSLTTDAGLLVALFAPHERDLVFGFDYPDVEDGLLRCLHVDLRAYDLDRHGLVNRFSDVLQSNDIHHLYYSTFKTANLLVSERDALRAQVLLRDC